MGGAGEAEGFDGGLAGEEFGDDAFGAGLAGREGKCGEGEGFVAGVGDGLSDDDVANGAGLLGFDGGSGTDADVLESDVKRGGELDLVVAVGFDVDGGVDEFSAGDFADGEGQFDGDFDRLSGGDREGHEAGGDAPVLGGGHFDATADGARPGIGDGEGVLMDIER